MSSDNELTAVRSAVTSVSWLPHAHAGFFSTLVRIEYALPVATPYRASTFRASASSSFIKSCGGCGADGSPSTPPPPPPRELPRVPLPALALAAAAAAFAVAFSPF
eukprot:9490437-Pyramimonas_sp.AAC.1